MESKIIIAASSSNKIPTEENVFLQLIHVKVYESFLFRQSQKIVVYFSLYKSSLVFQR